MKKTFVNNIRTLAAALLFCISLARCHSSVERENTAGVMRDETITTQNAYSQLQLDSTMLEQYISSHNVNDRMSENLRNFYNRRNFHFAWFTEDGLTEQANTFWNLHTSYVKVTGDSSIYDSKLHGVMQDLLEDGDNTLLDAEQLNETEMALTLHFFEYAKTAYQGKTDPADLQWHIPRKKVNVVDLLDTLVNSTTKNTGDWEPVNKDYIQLKQQLKRYYNLQQQGGWPTIGSQEVLRLDDSSSAIVALRKRLFITGDLSSSDTITEVFTAELKDAVKQAQFRLGLEQDGIVGPATLAALNIPVEDRITQMLVNLERMKWMPFNSEGTKLVANIPDYKLHVYADGKERFDMNIVVGKAGTNTVIFSDRLEYVVFSPYWNVPRSIVRNEILPKMKSDPGYLDRSNMEQTGTSNGLPIIRQKPGGNNALGRVKFIFPNNYNIYFHDTPSKHLFSRNERAFSHGCIRLEQPVQLAEYLLKNHPEWDSATIADAMYSEEEKWVKLSVKIPVMITYFTCWTDDNGSVHFREDIYGHDKKLMKQLFQ